ncbi:type IV pilus assembly protein PilA [Desulfacinum infernum DSM 9756]|jgi:type IV pilus assembly protein PilA|uniref:Type IV pilus assembly protein PilA n=1 Tax=Desulfacinum infernum DSM 9756 TaxID=1121391 RepID=A0A1M5DET1_9BACT|nr:pilin [Desulfacinum infernum]SHF65425.1 type IV pilus assembly protein PilA [Desulfacinum infernum DSM 9756]
MLIKMKESKGFTLVELMIVVAIIGILAAVAVPFYQRYVKKSRLTSLVIPGVHAIENSITTYYSVRGTAPDLSDSDVLNAMARDADTTCFDVEQGSSTISLQITIDDDETAEKCQPIKDLQPGSFSVVATVTGDGKLVWTFDGALAEELGLAD